MPTFDAAATLAGTGGSLTQSHTVGGGANMLLLVGLDLEGGTVTGSGVTWNGTALTLLQRLHDGNNSDRVGEFWYLIAPAAGTFNVIATFSAAADAAMRIVSYSGVDQSTPFGTVATGNPAVPDTAPSITVTSAVGELVVDNVSAAVLTTATAGGAQTERAKLLDAGGPCVFGSEAAGATSVVMSWTISTARRWVAIGVSVKASATVPGGWSVYRPYTLGSAIAALTTGGLFYYWRRRKQEKPDE